MLDIIGLFWF